MGSSSAASPSDRQPYVAVEGLSDVILGVGKQFLCEIPAASSMLVPVTPGGLPAWLTQRAAKGQGAHSLPLRTVEKAAWKSGEGCVAIWLVLFCHSRHFFPSTMQKKTALCMQESFYACRSVAAGSCPRGTWTDSHVLPKILAQKLLPLVLIHLLCGEEQGQRHAANLRDRTEPRSPSRVSLVLQG